MTIILSYALFDQPDKNFNRSAHDPYDRKQNRYWLNIPFLVISNSIIFKNSITRIHVPKILQNNPMYDFLHQLTQKIQSLQLDITDKPYIKTEPTVWRLKPLWNDNIDYCFCRDLDSVVTEKEAKSMIFFMQSDYWIHNIRSTRCHNGEGTSLMAGLCGFKIKPLRTELPLPTNFEKYVSFYKNTYGNGEWGCDQETLLNFFIRYRSQRILDKVLDTYIRPNKTNRFGSAYMNKHYKIKSIAESMFADIKINDRLANEVLSLSNTTTSWAGEPIDASGMQLRYLINKTEGYDVTKTVMSVLNSKQKCKAFYSI